MRLHHQEFPNANLSPARHFKSNEAAIYLQDPHTHNFNSSDSMERGSILACETLVCIFMPLGQWAIQSLNWLDNQNKKKPVQRFGTRIFQHILTHSLPSHPEKHGRLSQSPRTVIRSGPQSVEVNATSPPSIRDSTQTLPSAHPTAHAR